LFFFIKYSTFVRWNFRQYLKQLEARNKQKQKSDTLFGKFLLPNLKWSSYRTKNSIHKVR